jgi:hypothetical protein
MNNIIEAMNLWNPDNYVPFDDSLYPHKCKNPEEILIEKDEKRELSPIAQKAIAIIFELPESVTSNKVYKTQSISWRKIQGYLTKEHDFTWKQTHKVKEEISQWLRTKSFK